MKNIKIFLLLLSIVAVGQITAIRTNYKKPALRTLKKENNALKRLAKVYKLKKINADTRKLLKQYITNTHMITSLTKHMFDLEKDGTQQQLLNTVRIQLLTKKTENQKILLNIFKA